MKGFTITPVLFVGLVLITGLMLISFTDLDRRISEGISKESQLNRLKEDFMENRTATGVLLLFHSANESTYASDRSGLESAIGARMGGPVEIVSCQAGGFTVEFNQTFSDSTPDAWIDETYSIRKGLDCDRINGLTDRNATVSCGSVTLSCLGA